MFFRLLLDLVQILVEVPEKVQFQIVLRHGHVQFQPVDKLHSGANLPGGTGNEVPSRRCGGVVATRSQADCRTIAVFRYAKCDPGVFVFFHLHSTARCLQSLTERGERR